VTTIARQLDPAHFAIGERVPSVVHAPANVEDLQTLVADCDRRGRAIVFFGGGTHQGIGGVPARYDDAIVLTKFSRVLAEDARDLTIAAEGGCTIAALSAALAKHGQFVPFDVPRAQLATVGGTLAAGWLGPRRAAYGRPRDFTIGTHVVLADGSLAHAGGMVVKNATGYDLSKLYIGSLGTLAAIVRANVKTVPLPRARRIAIAALPERSRTRTRANIAALSREPTAALLFRGFQNELDGDDGPEGRAFLLFEGSEAFVEQAVREMRSALGSAGVPATKLIDREVSVVFERALGAYTNAIESRSATLRSYGLPGDSTVRVDACERVARDCDLVCETIEDLRTGDVVARLSAATENAFAERIAAFDGARRTALGTARFVTAPARVRATLDVWGAPPETLAATRALKARFDPGGTLAPGRFVGGV
jgi:glycolate oxidase FAD binding subunit